MQSKVGRGKLLAVRQDLTDRLYRTALLAVGEHGWSDFALTVARRQLAEEGLPLPVGAERLLFPAGGRGLLERWFKEQAEAAATALVRSDLQGTTRRVEFGVRAFLDCLDAEPALARRAHARLLLPDIAPLRGRLLWYLADAIWSAVPDPSLDYNWYSKRAILAGVLASTLRRHHRLGGRDGSVDQEQVRVALVRDLQRAVKVGGTLGKGVKKALNLPETIFRVVYEKQGDKS